MSIYSDVNKVQQVLDGVETDNETVISMLKKTKNTKYKKCLYYIGNPKYKFASGDLKISAGDYHMSSSGWCETESSKTHGCVPFSVLNNITRGNINPTENYDVMEFEKRYRSGVVDHIDSNENRVYVSMDKEMIWFDADWFYDHDLTKG